MTEAMSTIDWVGLVGPILFYVVSLAVYYIYEGKRERRLRSEYGEVTADDS